MYLHLGHSAVADFRDVVGVFDLDNVTCQKRTRDTLERLEEQGRLHVLGQRLPVSLVVTAREVYLSPVSSSALGRRLAQERWE